MTAAGVFAEWQPRYARHGVATFPVKIVDDDKIPATCGYMKTGLRGSGQLAIKFAAAQSFGFVCGARNRVIVIDMDDRDPAIINEGERLYGASPLLWRTGGGKFAMAFRYNGEARRIRPIPSLPIDLLGGGFCVALPSAGARQPYEIVRGTLADLDRLPVARIPEEVARTLTRPDTRPERILDGHRGAALFEHCNSIVRYCDTLDQLVDAAVTWADERLERLPAKYPHAKIVATCTSVFNYRGGRKKMLAGPFVEREQFHELVRDQAALALFAHLSMTQGPTARFMIANGLADSLGWPRRSIPSARKALADLKIIECVRKPRPSQPALYRWAIPHE
jgi:hypothetical protein